MHAYYKTSDRDIMVVGCMNEDQSEKLLENLFQQFNVSNISDFERCIQAQTANQVCEQMNSLNISAIPISSIREIVQKYKTRCPTFFGPSFQFVVIDDHPIGCITVVAKIAMRCPRFTFTDYIAPKYGTDTFDLLREIHSTKLILKNIASVGWSRLYIPCENACTKCGAKRKLVVLPCCGALCVECVNTVPCVQYENHRLSDLQKSVVLFARGYSEWRKGHSKGARDMHRIFLNSAIKKTQSLPHLYINNL